MKKTKKRVELDPILLGIKMGILKLFKEERGKRKEDKMCKEEILGQLGKVGAHKTK